MTKNKFEWTATITFMVGLILVISGFDFDIAFKIDLGDIINIGVIILGIVTFKNTVKSHKQQLEPFINYYSNFDMEKGEATLTIQNVGGGFAKINHVFIGYKISQDTYTRYFFWNAPEVEKIGVKATIDDSRKPEDLLIFLYSQANDTFRELETPKEPAKVNVQTSGIKFKIGNALDKGESNNFFVISDEILKGDSPYPNFREALFAHIYLLDIFMEYESVTGEKHYLPSKEVYEARRVHSLRPVSKSDIKMSAKKNA